MIQPTRLVAWLARSAAIGVVSAGAATLVSRPLGRRAYRGVLGMAAATLQTLIPHLAGATAVIAALAAARRQRLLATSSLAVSFAACALTLPLIGPLVARRVGALIGRAGRPELGTPGTALRIATANLLYTNDDTEVIADDLLARGFDVLAFTEYTVEHQQVLQSHALASRYPHRVDRAGPRALGVAVWSRLPLDVCPPAATVNHSVDVRVHMPERPFRLLAVHTPTPFDDLDGWADDLEIIRDIAGECDEPMVVIGDLNATCWHPVVDAILRAGYTDALVATGRPFAASWPIESIVPPFAQLDHALIGRGLMAAEASNFPVPGSDHRGLSVTVVPAR